MSEDRERPAYEFQPGQPGGPGRPPVAPPTEAQCRLAKKACQLGATDQELASILEVTTHVLRRWQVTDEAFSHACRIGGDLCDARVERALYSRAVGFTRKITREQVTKDGDIVDLLTVEEVAPDTAAASRWLDARKRKDWGIKSVVEHDGELRVTDGRRALSELAARHAPKAD